MGIIKEIKAGAFKVKSNLELIAGIITVIIGISSHFSGKLKIELNLVIVSVGVYVIARGTFSKIKNASVTRMGKTEWQYSEKERKWARIMLTLNNILIPLLVVTSTVFYFMPDKQTLLNKKRFGIVISRFVKTGEDAFAINLNNHLNDVLDEYDTIGIETSGAYLPVYSKDKMEALKDTFTQTGFRHGMLVFGNRIEKATKEESDFECRIYVCKVKNKMIDAYIKHKKPVIKAPVYFEFQVGEEAKKVSYFILGLLFNGLGNFEKMEEKILEALKLHNVKTELDEEEKKFGAYCYLLLGDGKAIRQDYIGAEAHYKMGLSLDSADANLHYNLGVLLLNDNDSAGAYLEFEKANRYNKDFEIPFAFQLDKTSADEITSAKEKEEAQRLAFEKAEKEKMHKEALARQKASREKAVADSLAKIVADKRRADSLAKAQLAARPAVNTPQVLSDDNIKQNVNNYKESDLVYQATFVGPPKMLYFVTWTNHLLLYDNKGNYRIVGKADLKSKYTLTDLHNNVFQIGAGGIIYNNKGVGVGKFEKL